ncbi:hypothetical protein ACI2IY_05860 [Lysobacter enzymogenes]|uniref:hypothetical protein n=1 Tax=Lysobacter enzymogenes TaxID=69 RepID=UPI00384FEC09
MADLDRFAAVTVNAFARDGSDAMAHTTGLLELIEEADVPGELELGFDLANPTRRVYVRVRADDLQRLLNVAREGVANG